MSDPYRETPLSRAEVDASRHPRVIEFGAPWCGICAAAQPAIDAAFAAHPGLERLKVWDGPGQPLGRSFGIKLWPALVLLEGGVEVARLVRPTDRAAISAALDRLMPPSGSAPPPG